MAQVGQVTPLQVTAGGGMVKNLHSTTWAAPCASPWMQKPVAASGEVVVKIDSAQHSVSHICNLSS